MERRPQPIDGDGIMKITGNTMLITGGGSGIGRELARRFHDLGNTVIVAGRTAATLEETISGRREHARDDARRERSSQH